jgi:hypothetical protein
MSRRPIIETEDRRSAQERQKPVMCPPISSPDFNVENEKRPFYPQTDTDQYFRWAEKVDFHIYNCGSRHCASLTKTPEVLTDVLPGAGWHISGFARHTEKLLYSQSEWLEPPEGYDNRIDSYYRQSLKAAPAARTETYMGSDALEAAEASPNFDWNKMP